MRNQEAAGQSGPSLPIGSLGNHEDLLPGAYNVIMVDYPVLSIIGAVSWAALRDIIRLRELGISPKSIGVPGSYPATARQEKAKS